MVEQNYDHLKPTQFKPGQSGNLKGRPKGAMYLSKAYEKILRTKLPPGTTLPAAFTGVLKEMVEEGATMAEFIALAQVREAIKGKTHAASEIADRSEGRPRQQHQITGMNEGPLQMANYDYDKLSPEDLRVVIGILSKAAQHDSDSEAPKS